MAACRRRSRSRRGAVAVVFPHRRHQVVASSHDVAGARDVHAASPEMNVRHVGGDAIHEYRVVHLLKAVVKVVEVEKPHVGPDVDGVGAIGEAGPKESSRALRGRTLVAELHKHSIFEKVVVERAMHVLVAEQEMRRRQPMVRIRRDVGSPGAEIAELHETVIVEPTDEGDAVGVHERRLMPDHGKV